MKTRGRIGLTTRCNCSSRSVQTPCSSRHISSSSSVSMWTTLLTPLFTCHLQIRRMFSQRSSLAASRSRSSASHCLQLLRRALTLVRQHNVLRRPTERSRRRCIILQGALHTGPHAEQRRQARTVYSPDECCRTCPVVRFHA